jgi:phage shock protein PspC (stress-responsive transcriptional regulator)
MNFENLKKYIGGLTMNRKLKRITGKECIGGVCAGVAYWLGLPTWIVRLVWAWFVLFVGIGLVLYILMWIFMPKWKDTPDDYEEVAE